MLGINLGRTCRMTFSCNLVKILIEWIDSYVENASES